MCQAMYHKPVRSRGSVPSTYVTFDVTKERNHILWCVRRLKKDSKSSICAFYSDLGEGQGRWTEDQVDILYT